MTETRLFSALVLTRPALRHSCGWLIAHDLALLMVLAALARRR